MIVKACFGHGKAHCRIIECHDVHIEEKDGYVEAILHNRDDNDKYNVLNFGNKGATDHLYIMDKGETVDHMTFYPVDKKKKQ